VQGRVVDPSKAPVAGARITAIADGQTAGSSTVTDQRGEFTLSLAPGRYVLHVAADGFRETTDVMTLAAAAPQQREFVLEIAGVREAVTVSAPAGYHVPAVTSATKTLTPLRNVPQSITVVTQQLMRDQLMMSIGDVVRYVPGITSHQGENNRDQVIIRGHSSSADFFVNGVRDDVQYYRDLYNLERVEAIKGSNAMIFGRGGAGGVLNRVTKEALFRPIRAASLQGGQYDNKRFTADIDQPLNGKVALRVNGLYESSDSFRTAVGLERFGVTPTVTILPASNTKITLRYEYLRDRRVADRGITSFNGRPADVDDSTYYGNPDLSDVKADVNLAAASIEHRAGAVTIRNHTLVGDYGRFYQNFVPGAATPNGAQVALSSYNNATDRTNLFNQTDVTYALSTGGVRHTLLAGTEFGRQLTDNFRNTGFFNDTTTSVLVPFGNPTTAIPVSFRQNATDADNHVVARVMAAYAQDQIALTQYVDVLTGVRFDRFDLEYHNNRNGETLDRVDNLVSPRVGLIVKPLPPLSVYGAYSVSYLPSSGDQFASLTAITQQLKPEKFNNYELGAKWDVSPALAVTTAIYRLNRLNTRSTDPNDPTRIVQTGSQRTNGYELGVNGRVLPDWSVAGGYAYQDALVTSATAAARAGAQVAQVPHHTLSLWNHYQFHPRVAGGLGIIYRSGMFAAIDNTVTLPGYTRADAAVFVSLTRQLRLQGNVENLFDQRYYVNADSNTNISPGFPRSVRVSLAVAF
jgi:catecholate siderophore receptor